MAHNRREFLTNAIDSVINQTLDDDKYEIIVILNFQDPGLLQFSPRVRFIYHTDLTIGEVISLGVRESSGEIISFLDDDDIFLPGKLQKVREVFNKNPKLAYFHNNYLRFTSFPISDLEKGLFFSTNSLFLPLGKQNLRNVRKFLKYGGNFNMSCISIRKGFFPSDFKRKYNYLQDTIVFYLLLQKGDYLLDDGILTHYFSHNSISNQDINIIVEKSVVALSEVIGYAKGSTNTLVSSDLAVNRVMSEILAETGSKMDCGIAILKLIRRLWVLNFQTRLMIAILGVASLFNHDFARKLLMKIKY